MSINGVPIPAVRRTMSILRNDIIAVAQQAGTRCELNCKSETHLLPRQELRSLNI